MSMESVYSPFLYILVQVTTVSYLPSYNSLLIKYTSTLTPKSKAPSCYTRDREIHTTSDTLFSYRIRFTEKNLEVRNSRMHTFSQLSLSHGNAYSVQKQTQCRKCSRRGASFPTTQEDCEYLGDE